MDGWMDGRTEGRTEGLTDGQTDRHTDTHTHIHIYIYIKEKHHMGIIKLYDRIIRAKTKRYVAMSRCYTFYTKNHDVTI